VPEGTERFTLATLALTFADELADVHGSSIGEVLQEHVGRRSVTNPGRASAET